MGRRADLNGAHRKFARHLVRICHQPKPDGQATKPNQTSGMKDAVQVGDKSKSLYLTWNISEHLKSRATLRN